MLHKHFSVIMTIAMVFFMSLMAFGQNDLGVGVSIKDKTLNFIVYESGLRVDADFTTSYARTKSLPGEPSKGEVNLTLPVLGKKLLVIKVIGAQGAIEEFVVTVKLLTIELRNEPQLDKKSYDIRELYEEVIVDGEAQNESEIKLEEPIKIACYGEITKLDWRVRTNPNNTPPRDADNILITFIPLVDENGRLLLCKKDESEITVIEVPVFKVITDSCENPPTETFCRTTTWTDIMQGEEENDPPPCPEPNDVQPPPTEPPLCEDAGTPHPPCYKETVEEEIIIKPKEIGKVLIRDIRCGKTKTWTEILLEEKGN